MPVASGDLFNARVSGAIREVAGKKACRPGIRYRSLQVRRKQGTHREDLQGSDQLLFRTPGLPARAGQQPEPMV